MSVGFKVSSCDNLLKNILSYLSTLFKVAGHSFQEPMRNSPLLLSYLCFGTRFLQESRLTNEEFILTFWLRCVLLPWQQG